MKLLASLIKNNNNVSNELNEIFKRDGSVSATLVDELVLQRALSNNCLKEVMESWNNTYEGLINDFVQIVTDVNGTITVAKSGEYIHAVMDHTAADVLMYAVEGDEDYMSAYTPYLIEPEMVVLKVA